MMNEEERELLLSIIYDDTGLGKLDSQKIIQAIKSAMQEIDELKNIQRTEQGELIATEDEVITDNEEEYL